MSSRRAVSTRTVVSISAAWFTVVLPLAAGVFTAAEGLVEAGSFLTGLSFAEVTADPSGLFTETLNLPYHAADQAMTQTHRH